MQPESAAERSWTGARVVKASVAIGGLGVLPLLLYVMFGPADGNPIGLGLLAMATVPTGVLGVGVGLVLMLIERLEPGER